MCANLRRIMAKSIFKKKFNGLNNKHHNNSARKCVNTRNGIKRSKQQHNHVMSTQSQIRHFVRRGRASYRYRRKSSLSLSVVKCSPARVRHLHALHTLHTRAIKTSINRLLKKNNVNKSKKHCIFYCRFGRCNRDKDCPYIHDNDKIAVCSRFLRGACKLNECPLSHKLSRDKMPVCSYFLEGRCNSDNCHYRHIKVNSDADICKDFNRGYCGKGVECKSAHMFVCVDYNRDGKCPKGESCPLAHTVSHTNTKVGQNVIISRKKKGYKFRSHNCAINDIVLRHNNKTSTDSHCLVSDPLPSFIPLCDDNDVERTLTAIHSAMSDNENNSSIISDTLSAKLSEKLKYFWVESDDEINYLSSDDEESEETSCRPAIRIFPSFVNE